MKANAKSMKITVDLEKGLTAAIIIVRNGQRPANKSDEVTVKATLSLPKNEYNQLDERISFGDRLQIMDRELYSSWGLDNGKNRCRETYFYGSSWAKLFTEAQEYLFSEVAKIKKALTARQKALQDAEL